jgi:crotonobetainyl-CoA:carnitine CoA-transferase CaiB-like acyl-CoA transferase
MLVGCLNHAFYRRFLATIGHPELLDDPRFGGRRFQCLADAEELDTRIEQVIRQRPLAEWLAIFEAADVPAAPVLSADEAATAPQVEAMQALTSLPASPWGPVRVPGLAVHFSETPGSAGSGMAFGESEIAQTASLPWEGGQAQDGQDGSGHEHEHDPPLAGLRVLDCSSYIAGPYQSAILADLGAEVIKLESPSGDQFRDSFDNFISINRGKRSIVLDAKTPAGQRAAVELARRADVLVENLRPGTMERLGLGYDQLRPDNPRLVYSSLTAFGPIGPDRDKPGMDPVLQARAGMMVLQGGEAGPPIFMQVGVCDMAGAMLNTLGILGALFVREQSGSGQKVETSLLEATITFLHESYIAAPGLPPLPAARPDHLGRSPFRRLYQAADGWLLLAADQQPYRSRLERLLAVDSAPETGSQEFTDDREAGQEQALAALFGARPLRDCLEQLRQAGIPACSVPGYDAINCGTEVDQQRVRTCYEHPEYGEICVPGGLIVLDGLAYAAGRRAPLLGEHTAEILAEIGLAEAEPSSLGPA